MKTIVPRAQMDNCLFHCTHFHLYGNQMMRSPALFVLSGMDKEGKIRTACVVRTFYKGNLYSVILE